MSEVLLVLNWVVILTLFLASAAKLSLSAAERSAQLEQYQRLPRFFRQIGGFANPYIEIFIAASLLFARPWHIAHLGAALLFGIFTAVVLTHWQFGQDIECGCFGETKRERAWFFY